MCSIKKIIYKFMTLNIIGKMFKTVLLYNP